MQTVKVRHFDGSHGTHTATIEWLRELVLDQILSGAERIYKQLGEHIQHEYIDVEALDCELVELYEDKINLVCSGKGKITIERVAE